MRINCVPHLHTHCIVFNATFDTVEKQWKALQNHEMFAAQKFVENVYYHELTCELLKCGYQIENKPRGDFEIKGVAPGLIERFSKRHREIDQKTKELLARAPEKADGNIAAIRENIAHKERPRKIRDIGLVKLQTMWGGQMTTGEKASLQKWPVSSPKWLRQFRHWMLSSGRSNICLNAVPSFMKMNCGVMHSNAPEVATFHCLTFKPSRITAVMCVLRITREKFPRGNISCGNGQSAELASIGRIGTDYASI